MNGWHIVKSVDDADKKDIIRLRKIVFPGEDPDKELEEFWNWQFKNNFYGPAEIFLAKHKNQFVGHYAIIPQKFQFNGKEYTAGLVVDVMTHPDYRKQGMFYAIGRFALASTGTDFTIGYPIRGEVMPGHLKSGWEVVKKIPLYILPVNFEKIISHFISVGFVRQMAGASVRGFYKLFFSRETNATAYEIQKVKEISSAEVNFFGCPQKNGSIRQMKNNDYLRWRFDSNPLPNYEKFMVTEKKSGKPMAYFVLRKKNILDLSCMVMVDLLLKENNFTLLKNIMRYIRKKARAENQDCVACMLRDDGFISNRLKFFGMLKSPYHFKLIIHNNHTIDFVSMFRQEKNVFLNWADTDVM